MKKIEAIIKLVTVDKVIEALVRVGVLGSDAHAGTGEWSAEGPL